MVPRYQFFELGKEACRFVSDATREVVDDGGNRKTFILAWPAPRG